MAYFSKKSPVLRIVGAVFCLGLMLGVSSCGDAKVKAASFALGQRVQVGRLSYLVVDAQWRPDVPGGRNPVKNRVLQLHMMITNSGGGEATVPMLRLLDANGNEISEIFEIEGSSNWLGMIRRLQPALTEEGHIYFDVPVGAYKLEVVDNTEPDSEKTAYVDIPASLAPPPAAPDAPGR